MQLDANADSLILALHLSGFAGGTVILQYKRTEDNWPHILGELGCSASSISLPSGTKDKATDYQ